MENEIMNNIEEVKEEDVEIIEAENEASGSNFGVGALVVLGLAAAGAAAVKFGKKVWARYKEKKAEDAILEEIPEIPPVEESDNVTE